MGDLTTLLPTLLAALQPLIEEAVRKAVRTTEDENSRLRRQVRQLQEQLQARAVAHAPVGEARKTSERPKRSQADAKASASTAASAVEAKGSAERSKRSPQADKRATGLPPRRPEGKKEGDWVTMVKRQRRVTQPLPAEGTPLQPAAPSLVPYIKEGSFTAVLPRQNYSPEERQCLRDAGVQAISAMKWPTEWAVEGQEQAHTRVLLAGLQASEARDMAATAIETWAEVLGIGALVHLPPGKATAATANLEAIMAGAGVNPETLLIPGAHLQLRLHAKDRMSWQMKEGGTLVPRGHTLFAYWQPRQGVSKGTVEDVSPPLPATNAGYTVVCRLDAPRLLAAAAAGLRPRTQAWAKERTWAALKEQLPQLTTSPPMVVARRGSFVEVTFPMPGEEATAKLLRNSGRVTGVEFRPWISREGAAPAIPARMVWVKLDSPAVIREPRQQWKRLQSEAWFAGLMAGERRDRLGVRVWGANPPSDAVLTRIGELLGCTTPLRSIRVRVKGYPPTFGMEGAGGMSPQVEAQRVFGPEVRVVNTQHVAASGLIRPVFILTLTGTPPQWTSQRVPAADSRMRDCSWQRMDSLGSTTSAKPVSKGLRMPTVFTCAPRPRPQTASNASARSTSRTSDRAPHPSPASASQAQPPPPPPPQAIPVHPSGLDLHQDMDQDLL